VEIIRLIRDVAVIILAIETIVFFAALIFLIWQGWKLVGFAKAQVGTVTTAANQVMGTVKDTAETAKDAAGDVRGTVAFVNDRTAKPVIELYAAAEGARRFAKAVFDPHRNPPPPEPEVKREQ
jgi:hypothetical protein